MHLFAIALVAGGCFTHGSDHFGYPSDGIVMPDLHGRWMTMDPNGLLDSSYQVLIGNLPPIEPTWERIGLNDSLLRTRGGLYYRDGASFTYMPAEYATTADSTSKWSAYRTTPAMVISLFSIGNDTFFETHLPEHYQERPGIARLLRDSLGEGIATTILVRHHVGRVLHFGRDTIEYTWGWSNAERLWRYAQEQHMEVVFLPEGSYDNMLHGSTEDLRALLEYAARTDTIRDRFRFVRVGR